MRRYWITTLIAFFLALACGEERASDEGTRTTRDTSPREEETISIVASGDDETEALVTKTNTPPAEDASTPLPPLVTNEAVIRSCALPIEGNVALIAKHEGGVRAFAYDGGRSASSVLFIADIDAHGTLVATNRVTLPTPFTIEQGVSLRNGGAAFVGFHEEGKIAKAYLIRFDGEGRLLWQRAYGGSNSVRLHAVAEGDGETFLLAGEIAVAGGATDGILIKTKENGDIIWKQQYGGEGNEALFAVTRAIDYAYLIGGYRESTRNPHGWVLRVEIDGDMLWEELVGAGRVTALAAARDGSLLVAGESDEGALFAQVGYEGGVIHQTNMTTASAFYTIAETEDGAVILAGRNGNTLFSTVCEVNGTVIDSTDVALDGANENRVLTIVSAGEYALAGKRAVAGTVVPVIVLLSR